MPFDRGPLLIILRHYNYSFRLQPGYDGFRSKLEKYLPLLGRPALPTTGDKSIDAALKVLQTEGEDQMEGCNDVVDEADRPHGPAGNTLKTDKVIEIDKALEILVRNATEEFGFAPRDVYNGVLDLPATMAEHLSARKGLDYSGLKIYAQTFSETLGLNELSHRVVAVYPREHMAKRDRWAIGFKSTRIAGEVMKLMWLEEEKQLWEMYRFFRQARTTSPLAGTIFEAIVHHILSHGWQSDTISAPQPIRMTSNECEPLSFFMGPSSSSSFAPYTPLSPAPRAATPFTELSNVTLDKAKYYIPSSSIHPLFDSFTIEHNEDRKTIVISVFKVTISPNYRGSAKSYLSIHKIMIHLRKLLKEKGLSAEIKIAYFLVCPEEDGPPHRWQMPVGWGQANMKNDHSGEVFYICVPVPKRHGTSCHPNLAAS
jgi:hypothetical protein